MKLRTFAATLILGLVLILLTVPSMAAPPPPVNVQSPDYPFDPVEVALAARSTVQAGPALEGPRIEVAGETGDEITPAVAFSSQSQQYLVVYESPCTISGNNYASCICGTYVGSNGQILATSCLKSRANNRNPDVAYDPIHNRFGVVWEAY